MKLTAFLLTLLGLSAANAKGELFEGSIVRNTASQAGHNSYSEYWLATDGTAYQLSNYSEVVGAQQPAPFQNTPKILGKWTYSKAPADPTRGVLLVTETGGTQSALRFPLRFDTSAGGIPDTRRINLEETGLSSPYLFRHDGTPAARRLNCSSRIWITPGATSTFGFIVNHEKRYYLIRALGGSVYHVAVTAGTPSFKLFNSQGRQIASGAAWNATAEAETVFNSLFDLVWAARLRPEYKEEVLALRLDAGCYTIEVSNPKGETGDAMIEVFALPFTIAEDNAQ